MTHAPSDPCRPHIRRRKESGGGLHGGLIVPAYLLQLSHGPGRDGAALRTQGFGQGGGGSKQTGKAQVGAHALQGMGGAEGLGTVACGNLPAQGFITFVLKKLAHEFFHQAGAGKARANLCIVSAKRLIAFFNRHGVFSCFSESRYRHSGLSCGRIGCVSAPMYFSIITCKGWKSNALISRTPVAGRRRKRFHEKQRTVCRIFVFFLQTLSKCAIWA